MTTKKGLRDKRDVIRLKLSENISSIIPFDLRVEMIARYERQLLDAGKAEHFAIWAELRKEVDAAAARATIT